MRYRRFSVTMEQARVIELGLVSLLSDLDKIQEKEKDPYWDYIRIRAEELKYLLTNYNWIRRD